MPILSSIFFTHWPLALISAVPLIFLVVPLHSIFFRLSCLLHHSPTGGGLKAMWLPLYSFILWSQLSTTFQSFCCASVPPSDRLCVKAECRNTERAIEPTEKKTPLTSEMKITLHISFFTFMLHYTGKSIHLSAFLRI